MMSMSFKREMSEEEESDGSSSENSGSDYTTSISPFENIGEVVAIIGPPHSDKAKLINFLLGNPMTNYWNTGMRGAINVNETIADISHTYSPKKYIAIPKSGWNVWKFPGELGETLTQSQTEELQKQEVRLMVVATSDMVTEQKPWKFYKLLYHVKKIYANLPRGVCLVITKFDSVSLPMPSTYLMVRDWLKQAENAFDEEDEVKENLDIIKNGKAMIKDLLLFDNILYFKVINRSGSSEFNSKNTYFHSKIGRLSKTLVANIPIKVQGEISAIKLILPKYAPIYESLKGEVDEFCNRFTKSFNAKIRKIHDANGPESYSDIEMLIEFFMEIEEKLSKNTHVLLEVLSALAEECSFELEDSFITSVKMFYFVEGLSANETGDTVMVKMVKAEVIAALEQLTNLN